MAKDRRWPETITACAIADGVSVPVRVPHRLLNANDRDVSFAYINCSSMGGETESREAFERGYAKAKFEANAWSVDLTIGRLREVVLVMLAVMPPDKKLWLEPCGRWRGEPLERCVSINGVGCISVDGCTATFTAGTDAHRPEAFINGEARLDGERDSRLFVSETLPLETILQGAEGLRAWAMSAVTRLHQAESLRSRISALNVHEDRDD